MNDLIGIWIGAFLTLCIFSFLYKDNPFFRFAEALFAGISLGYYIGITFDQVFKPNLWEPLTRDFANEWHLIFPLIIGLNLYSRYVPKIAWFARSSLAFYVGYYVSVNMLQKLQGEVLPQSAATMTNLISDTALGSFNSIVVFVGVVSVLVYFFFSVEHKGVAKGISRMGIWYLMIGFGAAFGYTVMGRVSLLIGRMNFLWNDWIGGTLRAFGG